jgi:hypothetical protein
MARDASQAAAVGLELDFGAAGGTNQDFEEIRTDSHWEFLSLAGGKQTR